MEKKQCDYCGDLTDLFLSVDKYTLCSACANQYDENGDKTGYCSLECCINGRCDETC